MAVRECYIGVDLGLTGLKAAAFDEAGRQVAVVADKTPRAVVSARMHEVDMDGLARAVVLLLARLAESIREQGRVAVGLGITGHGNGLYPVDDLLRPVGPAIASSDSRAESYVAAIPAERHAELHAATGSGVWAGQPVPLLRWLRDERPDDYARIRWALCCKDWVVASLTGRVSADYSDASACGLVDLATRRLSDLPIEALGLPAETLGLFPEPQPSGHVVGDILPAVAAATGLPERLPVVAGCMDCVASTLGTGSRDSGDLTVIVGTWAINAVVASATEPPPAVTLSALLPDPSRMLCMEVSPTSASNLEWLAAAVGGAEGATPVAALLEEAAAIPAGADGLVFLPFVYGAGEPYPASGSFVGLSAFHRRGHLVRAVLEGVAHFHRIQLARVAATGLVALDRPARLAGGGARSELWAQIIADVTGLTFLRHAERELGALGVAALLPEAVGRGAAEWFDLGESSEVAPGANHTFYRGHADLFDAVLAAMVPAWRALDREN